MTDSLTSSMSATGAHESEQIKTIIYPFGKYEVTLQVTETGKFVGITGIKVNTDFLSYEQKLSTAESHDVEKYYREDDK